MNRLYVYSLSQSDELEGFCSCYQREKHAEIVQVQDLSEIGRDSEKIIINPLSVENQTYWSGILNYMQENKDKKIFLFAPNVYDVQIKKLTKNQKNVKSIFTKEDLLHSRKNMDSLMEALQ